MVSEAGMATAAAAVPGEVGAAAPPMGAPQLGPLATRAMPPVTNVGMAVMVLALAGGIDVAAYLPRHAPLGVPVGLLSGAAALLVVNVVLLARLQEFAWHVFWRVFGWSLLAYFVIAGMIEFVMTYDGTRGSLLVVMTALIAIFAVDVPVMLGFSVARYQEPKPAGAG
jgi:hypothetical protein